MIAVVAVLCAVIVAQAAALVWVVRHLSDKAAEERRFLVNQALADTPQDFAVMQAAARPDETVEVLAEARLSRPSTPAPLGL